MIAAGGIADGRGIAAAFALGAAGVQIGSAYLRCPESKVSAPARAALAQAHDDSTVVTNVMTGRPARGITNRLMREVGPDFAGCTGFSPCRHRSGAIEGGRRKAGQDRFHQCLGRSGDQDGRRNARGGVHPGHCRAALMLRAWADRSLVQSVCPRLRRKTGSAIRQTEFPSEDYI